VVRRQLLQRYEHQPFVSCLAGLYGCQWRRYQRAKAHSPWSRTHFALLIVTFFLTLIFLYFWTKCHAFAVFFFVRNMYKKNKKL
uniref:Uncharacterized protein n=1 Tax=Sinocyclocheilus rhinocerous TaxID=307959 RepID=A0A673GC36_9TELE